MFGRGNWAITGLDIATHADFVQTLNDPEKMLRFSQLAASAVTRFKEHASTGINPYAHPRLDDQDHPLSPNDASELATYTTLDADTREITVLSPEIRESDGFGFGEAPFRLNSSVPVYAFWFVSNEWKDVSDVTSLKEGNAYFSFRRPYKFLASPDKKQLDSDVRKQTAANRKQFPVILDFQTGRVFIENTNKNMIGAVQDLLTDLGVRTISVAWDFGSEGHWPKLALAKLVEESRYVAEFQKAAEDAARFERDEKEIIEDAEVRNIVRDFFAMTELESELWAGLATPAQIRLHKTTSGVIAQTPVNATMLLAATEEAFVAAANISLQERVSVVNKKTEQERVFRKARLTFELSENINLSEVGAALLRGFDLPGFKKDIQREIKASKQVPTIESFWFQWVASMNEAIRDIENTLRGLLDLDAKGFGIVPLYDNENSAVIEPLGADATLSDLHRALTNVIAGSLTVTLTDAK